MSMMSSELSELTCAKPEKPPKSPRSSYSVCSPTALRDILSVPGLDLDPEEQEAKQASDDDDEFEAALGPLEPVASEPKIYFPPVISQVKRDELSLSFPPATVTAPSLPSAGARDRMKMAQEALAELDNVVALESKYEAAQTELTPEEIAERSFRKMALFGTRAEKVVQERKAAADAQEAQRQKMEMQKREEERALAVQQENIQKRRGLNAMEGARVQREAEKSEELDVDLKPLPTDWASRDYNLPVADQQYWTEADAVFFCMDCKGQFLSGANPLTSRQRCLSCGQLYCAACCPVVGYSTLHKDLGKFRACKLCVQTTIAVAEKLKNRSDKNDQLRRVIAEKVEAGGDHCLVIGCQEKHRQHYCKYCKSKDATHFSYKCPKAPKPKK
jgi:hypothetical protein